MWTTVWVALAVSALLAIFALHPDHAGSRSEYALMVSFSILASLAFLSGGVTLRERRKRKRVTRHLAECVQDGQQIIGRCHATEKTREPAPEEEANAWANDIYTYLFDELGPEYAVRFNNPAGLSSGFTVLMVPYSHVESAVKWRSARLNEIMTELATQG